MISRIIAAALFVILVAATLVGQSNPVPLINSLNPPSANPGAQGFTMTVLGGGFSTSSVLNWNGSPRLTIVNSPSSLQAQINADDIAHIGTASVAVVNGGVGNRVSNVVPFPVRKRNPTIAFATDNNLDETASGIITTGDLNNDGKLDVVESIPGFDSGTLDVFFGNGDGSFQDPISTTQPFYPYEMIVGDFNNDGNLDIIGTYEVSCIECMPATGLLLGDGAGGFVAAGGMDGSLAGVADVNADGNLDVLIYFSDGHGYGGMRVYLGDGQGNFSQSQELAYVVGGRSCFGDFNGDGRLDVAIPFVTNKSVTILLGDGTGKFNYGKGYLPAFGAGNSIACVDMNNDGKIDLVTDGISVLLGNGDGAFTDSGGFQLTDGSSPEVHVLDFNGDGKLDVALEHFPKNLYSGEIDVLLGTGNGTFQAPITFPGGSFSLGQPADSAVGDFNMDGKLDMIVDAPTIPELLLQGTIRVFPLILNFDQVRVRKYSPPQIVKVTNIDSDTATLGKINITGNNRVDFGQKNNCGSTLASGASCSIGVVYKPTQLYWEYATLNVNDSALGSPQTVSLSGYGIQSSITLSPTQLAFPTLLVGTASQPQTVSVRARGNVYVNISSISTSWPPFSQTNNCPPSMSPGRTCEIQVTFTPNQKGVATGTLYVYDDAPGSPQTASLSGTGTIVKLSASSVNFGNQPVGTTSPGAPVKLTNVGTVTLNISGINFTGNNPGDFAQTNNCGGSVPAGGNCTITVTFTPQATGSRSATMNINDDGGGSPQTVALSGTGT
jgi:hypothetical protein